MNTSPYYIQASRIAFVAVFALAVNCTYATSDLPAPRANPYASLDNAAKLGAEMKPSDIRVIILKSVRTLNSRQRLSGETRACRYLFTAELMKRVGDYRALQYYHSAIAAEPREPAFELFLAEYLRVFRGAGRPQFQQAERHYFRARDKLALLAAEKEWDAETRRRVHRSMIALYEADGLAIQSWNSSATWPFAYPTKPLFFFSSVNTYGVDTNDVPEIDDVRDFTSEAMFSASSGRLNRSLSAGELRAIAREKDQFESVHRLRIRPGFWPVIDATYRSDRLDNAQLTNFFIPGEVGDVNVEELAVAASYPWMTENPSLDWFGAVEYKSIRRTGVVEFLPNVSEQIHHVQGTLAAKRFVGPDALLAEGTVAFQGINPELNDPPRRDRLFASCVLRYFLFRQFRNRSTFERNAFDSRFDPRGIELFGGILHDHERFDDVNVFKNDYFMGGAIRGVQIGRRQNLFRSFDFTIQCTVFDSEVDGDPRQDNAQYRTNVTWLGRIKDEEVPPQESEDIGRFYPAFIHLVIPFRHDARIEGIDDFENWSIGAQINAKYYNTDLNGASFLMSAGYTRQSFFRIDRRFDLVMLKVGMGF